jgi:hypothetical protein
MGADLQAKMMKVMAGSGTPEEKMKEGTPPQRGVPEGHQEALQPDLTVYPPNGPRDPLKFSRPTADLFQSGDNPR